MILRQCQLDAVEGVRAKFREKYKRVLLQAATGFGKTVVANYIMDGAVAKLGRVLFLAAQRELVHQAVNRISGRCGVIMAGDKRTDPDAPVQVASVQTLLNRSIQFEPTLIFLDECSHSTAKSHQELLARFPDVPVVGLTATPVRNSGMGLGDYFDAMVQAMGIEDLIKHGWLVRPKHYAGPPNGKPLPDMFSDPIQAWMQYARGRATMAFCSSVEASKELAARATMAGIRARHIDGTTDDDIRDQIAAQLESGELEFVTNYQVYIEGVDIPKISCVILDRYFSNIAGYLQAVGRGLRTYPGKSDCIVLDHAGCIHSHGRVDQNRKWVLTKGRDVLAGPSTPDVADKIDVCPECFTVAPAGASHCVCGYKFFRKPKKTYKHKPGTLELHHDDGRVTTINESKQRSDYERFLWQQRNGKKKDGSPMSPRYAGFRFFQQYGIWPPKSWSS